MAEQVFVTKSLLESSPSIYCHENASGTAWQIAKARRKFGDTVE
jgi:hypothetical protein